MTQSQRMRESLLRLLLVIASIVLVLGGAEIILRLVEYRKTAPAGGFHSDRWAAPDKELGWITRPGYWGVDIRKTPMTILYGGERLTKGEVETMDEAVCLLVGGSYMLGYGVADNDTIASNLRRRYPAWHFVNVAVPGYGTYQSYLMLKRYVEEHPVNLPRRVVYGYMDHHGVRNIAPYDWIKGLSSYRGVHIAPPHLERAEDGSWVERPYEEINFLGLADNLSLVYFLQDIYLRYTRPLSHDEGPAATCHILGLMQGFCEEHGIEFDVVNISKSDPAWSEATEKCAREKGIGFADCSMDIRYEDPEWFLTKDGEVSGHPNEKYHAAVAQCIATKLPLPAK